MEGEQIVDEINNLLSEKGCSIVSFNLQHCLPTSS